MYFDNRITFGQNPSFNEELRCKMPDGHVKTHHIVQLVYFLYHNDISKNLTYIKTLSGTGPFFKGVHLLTSVSAVRILPEV